MTVKEVDHFMPEQYSLSACIVSYCDYDEVCTAVRSILENTPGALSLYVVDNASPDGCGRKLAATNFKDSRVNVITLPENVGFGRGHNTVLPLLKSRYHFILNPDVIVKNDVLHELADWLDAHPQAAMATPQLYYPDGHIQNLPRRKPTPWLLFARQLAPKFPGSPFDRSDRHYTMQDEDLSRPHSIEFCTGSFMAIRTEIFQQVGGFDEDYFMYVEDADLTQKILRKGQVFLVPQCRAIHAWHRAPARDAGKFKMQLISMIRYFKKWGIGKGNV